MHVNDILAAARDRRVADIREGFAALISSPGSAAIEAAGPGFLLAALDRVITALADDHTPMPDGCAHQLDLPAVATFAEGAAVARKWRREMPQHFSEYLGAQRAAS